MTSDFFISIVVLLSTLVLLLLIASGPVYYWYTSRNTRMQKLAQEFGFNFENLLSYKKIIYVFFAPLDSVQINKLSGLVNGHKVTLSDRIGYFRYTGNSIDETGAFKINMLFMTMKFLMPVKVIKKELESLK